mgnify:CR=1 FL=1
MAPLVLPGRNHTDPKRAAVADPAPKPPEAHDGPWMGLEALADQSPAERSCG